MANAQSKHGGARVGFPPPFVFLGLILSGVALQYGLAPLPLPVASPLRLVLGAAIAISGLALVLSEDQELIDRYRSECDALTSADYIGAKSSSRCLDSPSAR